MAGRTRSPELRQGVYTIPDATRIIGRNHAVSRRKISAWLTRGETYGRFDGDDGTPLLTFADLVSLKVVAKLRDEGVSSQRVRRLERLLRDHFPTVHQPFAAVGIYYTDGKNLWAALDADAEDVVEIIGKRPDQFVLAPLLRVFASEIRVADDGVSAASWHLAPSVEMSPEIQFGRPVVEGTRVPVQTVLANLEVGTVEQVAEWFGLSAEQVAQVREFELAS